ncbi:hypothetical protein A6M21_12855 [Desulfotomaculum copahuensis]|uniref:Uncharacterized protein n=1 Tax=Desulfotomaculum copahuensis TaxID=1838280 RepID=A0A1B7LCT3_9FIRM|nr:hypothetical protein A6M21_12855 [Desulfotomaculum copahuensis]
MISIAVMGSLGEETASRFVYKYYSLYRQIKILGIDVNFELVFLTVWIFLFIPLLSLYQHTIVSGMARLAGLSDCKHLILPVGLLLFDFSLLFFNNRTEFNLFATYIYPPLSIIFFSGLSLVLFLMYMLR